MVLAKDRIKTGYDWERDKTLVVGSDGACWCYSHDLVIKEQTGFEPIEEMKELSQAGEEFTGTVPEDEIFILIDKYGRVTDPMRSQGTNGDGVLQVSSCHLRTQGRRNENQDGASVGGSYAVSDCDSRVDEVAISETAKSPCYVENDDYCRLMTPKGTRILKLKTEVDDKAHPSDPSTDRRIVSPLSVLANSAMDDDDFRKIAITVHRNGNICQLNGHRMQAKDAVFALMAQAACFFGAAGPVNP